jgi:hypothetical protein
MVERCCRTDIDAGRRSSPVRALPDSVEIIRFPQMVGTGRYTVPVAFGGMGKPVNSDGFSDHYPIAVKIDEDD